MTTQSTRPPPGTWNARNLLTVSEVAEWARVHPKTVYRCDLITYAIEYVVPFELGNRWYAGFEIPNSNDPAYQWYVESLVDVTVPAGNFKGCYRIRLM
jgi:hypothetical protein